CTAVGGYTNGEGTPLALAEAWNGTSWQLQIAGIPSDAASSRLSAVSCTSTSPTTSICTAVGGYVDADTHTPLTMAESWSGTSWNLESTINPSGGDDYGLAGVSCATASACIAVGSDDDTGLSEVWNGSVWSVPSTPRPSGSLDSLSGVSCTAASVCTAVGSYTNASEGVMTVAEAWNGTSWKIQATANPAPASNNFLSGVSCLAAVCTAAGNYSPTGTSTTETLVERYA
ncbi:MAG TPA: hypothetical protein VEH29_00950, partial [Acidimicrobiales bacterium]|nr:hypothetical protein [Acidimicrobiales bacterium]